MYVWNESVASRGGQEIGSCLLQHFKKNIAESIENIILYSDSCGGQNRNIKLTLLLKHFLASSQVKNITQKYFISGHSYNSCDRCFSLIEKCQKGIEIVATPDDWLNIIKESKKTNPTFNVQKMETEDFVSSLVLEKLIVNRKLDTTGKKINWFKAHKIVHDQQNIFDLTFISENLEQRVTLKKCGVSEDNFKNQSLDCLFPNGKKITKAKYTDLMQLMSYIPGENRKFYEKLKYDGKSDADCGLASDQSDTSDE